MELEEAVKYLEEYLDKEDRKFVSEYRLMFLKSIETLIKYIKEESVPKAMVGEKIKEVRQLENVSIADMIESEKEFCIDVLQELLNKGEK